MTPRPLKRGDRVRTNVVGFDGADVRRGVVLAVMKHGVVRVRWTDGWPFETLEPRDYLRALPRRKKGGGR